MFSKRKLRLSAIGLFLGILLAAVGMMGYKIIGGKAYIWLPDYIARQFDRESASEGSTTHVMFLFVDHYEPGLGARGIDRNRIWLEKYRALADRHRDSYGRPPQHTWFYAYDHRNVDVMKDLSGAVRDGYGEIEFHWHHGPDTNESFPPKLAEAVRWFNKFGALTSGDNGARPAFAFIHGNWALDGAGKKDFCGVTRELDILKEAGCYGDFTFPAFAKYAQPSKVNSIYYAKDDGRPKSYDRGIDAQVNRKHEDLFLIFEGPLALVLSRDMFEYGAVEIDPQPTTQRVDRWIHARIHVRGLPEWIFVKIFTHGSQSENVIFGAQTEQMFEYLEEKYSKGRFRLHYVTAREAVNIVKAAEDGNRGDPDLFRNYLIKEPFNKTNNILSGSANIKIGKILER